MMVRSIWMFVVAIAFALPGYSQVVEPIPTPVPEPGPVQPETFVGPAGIVHEKILARSFTVPAFLDFKQTIVLFGEDQSQDERYPFGVRYTNQVTTTSGVTVLGVQSRELTWNDMKRDYDGDGIRIDTGNYKLVENCFVDNVEDGITFHGGVGGRIEYCWIGFNRDDCIELDSRNTRNVTIANCLLEGYVAISARAGSSAPDLSEDTQIYDTIRVHDCVIGLVPMPDDHPRTKFAVDGKAIGQFFKREAWGCRWEVKRTVLYAPQMFARGKTPMNFPPESIATYEDVTLVCGEGEYDHWVSVAPAGVMVTTDKGVYQNAKRKMVTEQGYRWGNRSVLYDLAN